MLDLVCKSRYINLGIIKCCSSAILNSKNSVRLLAETFCRNLNVGFRSLFLVRHSRYSGKTKRVSLARLYRWFLKLRGFFILHAMKSHVPSGLKVNNIWTLTCIDFHCRLNEQ